MGSLKIIAWVASAAAHLAVLIPLMDWESRSTVAFAAGEGNDQLHIESAIPIEGITRLGDAKENVEAIKAVETPPQEAQEAVEKTKEVEEVPELTEVITAKAEPVQEAVVPEEEPEKLEEQKPEQKAVLPQVQQVAVEEKRAASGKQKGGDPTKRRAYLGKLRSHIERFKIKPRKRRRGTVIVRFTVDSTGAVVSREITKSSGSKLLDTAALRSIDKAAPFPAFTEGVGSEPVVVSLPFKFTVR